MDSIRLFDPLAYESERIFNINKTIMETKNGLRYKILTRDFVMRPNSTIDKYFYNTRVWLIDDSISEDEFKSNSCTSCNVKAQIFYIPEIGEHLCEDCAKDYIDNNYITPNDLYSVNEAVINHLKNTICNDIINENEADRLLSSLENSETEP